MQAVTLQGGSPLKTPLKGRGHPTSSTCPWGAQARPPLERQSFGLVLPLGVQR